MLQINELRMENDSSRLWLFVEHVIPKTTSAYSCHVNCFHETWLIFSRC